MPADDDVIDRINELLDSTDPETVNTSMRISRPLRDAAALAVSELNVAPSATVLAANALRSLLEIVVREAVLEKYFEENPELRPTLADLAIAAAELDANPLARQPELIARAAAEVGRRHPGADPEDVLLWAEAVQSCTANGAEEKGVA